MAEIITGVLEEFDPKPGNKQDGTPYTRYGVKLDGAWYSTFSDTDGATLGGAYQTGEPVVITYEIKGNYKNIQSVSLQGGGPEPAAAGAAAAATATSAPTQPAEPARPAPPAAGTSPAIQISGDEIVDLSEYEAQGYLVIYPTEGYIRQVSTQHKVRLEVITPDPRPDKDKNRDFYKQGDNWAPKKTLLLKVSDAGGLRWDPDRCGFETNQPLFKLFKAVGFTLDAAGKPKAVIGHKELDLEVEIGDIRERAKTLKKGYGNNARDANEDEKQQYIHNETLRLRKHAGSNCETKAYLRAVRAAFQLPATFTTEEIRKPWLIPRIDFTPDYSDPQVQAQLATQGASAGADLYPAVNYENMPAEPIGGEEFPAGEEDEDEVPF